jgi:nucleotide-binding universal stress UspA family protein
MKKILIALDYNPSAEKVAEAGYALAKAMHAEVTLLHVMTDPAWYAMEYSPIMGFQGGYTEGTLAVAADIKKEADSFLAATVQHLQDSNIKTLVLDGEIEDSILQYAGDWKADFIVMGSHRHKGLDRLLVTDQAAHVLKHAAIPLLIIPTDDK